METHLSDFKEELLMKKLLSIVIFLFLPVYCFAYENSMIIADIELSLGMPKDKVIDMFLKRNYHVSSSGETYVVSQKKDDLNDFLGSVSFENNKLSFISTRWYYTHTDSGSFELAEKVFDLLKQETQNGKTITPVVKITSLVQPLFKIDSIDIIIDNKTINLSITKGGEAYGHQISIFKSIRSK
jgi:hypothetical protein